MLDDLATLETLLRRYGQDYQASVVAATRHAWRTDRPLALERLAGPDWWEAPDSVAAVDLAVAGGFSPAARADHDRFLQALLRVHEQMTRAGARNPRAGLLVAEFRKWLASGM